MSSDQILALLKRLFDGPNASLLSLKYGNFLYHLYIYIYISRFYLSFFYIIIIDQQIQAAQNLLNICENEGKILFSFLDT